MNNRLPNIHPGEILQLEFLEPMNITPYIAILFELQICQPSETRFLRETGFLSVCESFRIAID